MKSFKKWYENQNFIHILNNGHYRNWLYKNNHIEIILTLTADNREIFKKLYGEQTATYTTHTRYWIWKQTYKGITFLHFSSKEGSSTEFNFDDYKKISKAKGEKEAGKILIKFMKKTLNDIKKRKVK